MINVAVMGYGTVGSGVVEVLEVNKDIIRERVGEEVSVRYVLDIRDFPGSPIEGKLIHDFDTLAEDKEVQIVAEVMGGTEPAYTFVKRCLLAGKSVVTSNKALVAKYGAELLELAKKEKVNFFFEASVGGGIPIIRALEDSLTADEIGEVTGILNGTTNYMMSKMFSQGADYDEVLKEAQEKGYAERNPEADVEGHDACRKIAILSSLISGHRVEFEDIYTEGITKITREDMLYAKKMGLTIRLLAQSRRIDGRISAIVAPVLLSREHPLCNVDGVFNAVFVRGNMLGDAMFYGSGAGKLPTASAVVADIIDAARNPVNERRLPWDKEKLDLIPNEQTYRRFFVRIEGDAQELKSRLEKVFGPIETVRTQELENESGFLTEVMSEGEYARAAEQFPNIIHMIRVES